MVISIGANDYSHKLIDERILNRINQMRGIVVQIIFWWLCLSVQAQKVSNIRAEQRGQDIVVLYSLETSSPCEVRLLLSQDNGITWSAPLKNVKGDVGRKISGGENEIVWKLLLDQEQLVSDYVKFKVIANTWQSFEPTMVFVEGGEFQMGYNSDEEEYKPAHTVVLSSFYISKFEITEQEWELIMSDSLGDIMNKTCQICYPQSCSYNQANKLIEKLNFITGKKYRMPTEAEWEFAARGGKLSKGYYYSGSYNMKTSGWYSENANGGRNPVGLKIPNELGIYDMSGNLQEWCLDWYSKYDIQKLTNPKGLVEGTHKILRGGAYNSYIDNCRVFSRSYEKPDVFSYNYGLRLVLSAE